MAKAKKTAEKEGKGFLGWMGEAAEAWRSGLKPALSLLAGKLEERVERWEKRLLGLLVAYLCFFTGVFFLALGVFFALVDLAGLPRWAVFSGGGAVFLLSSLAYVWGGRDR